MCEFVSVIPLCRGKSLVAIIGVKASSIGEVARPDGNHGESTTCGDRIEEVETEMGLVKMRLEEVAGQVGSVI